MHKNPMNITERLRLKQYNSLKKQLEDDERQLEIRKQQHEILKQQHENDKKILENKNKHFENYINEVKAIMLKDDKYLKNQKKYVEMLKNKIIKWPNACTTKSDTRVINVLETLINEVEKEHIQLIQGTSEINPNWSYLAKNITETGTFKFDTKNTMMILSNGDFTNAEDLSYIHMAVSILPTLNLGLQGMISLSNIGEFDEITLKFDEKYKVDTPDSKIYAHIYVFQKDDLMRIVFGFSFVNNELYKIRVTSVILPSEKRGLKTLFDHSAIFTEDKWTRI